MDNTQELVNRFPEYGQQKRAERHAVEHGARGGEEDRVEPRAARAGAQTQQKQPREHDQRIEHIEQHAPGRAAVRTGRAQRIEHQPERKAQRERERREHRLILYRGSHPKSFAQKPSPRWGVSA